MREGPTLHSYQFIIDKKVIYDDVFMAQVWMTVLFIDKAVALWVLFVTKKMGCFEQRFECRHL